jgi:hypothetical protein
MLIPFTAAILLFGRRYLIAGRGIAAIRTANKDCRCDYRDQTAWPRASHM